MKKKTAYLDKNQADKSKLFPSRRVLIKTLQRRKHKCVSLIQQNQGLQEEDSSLEQKLQDDRSLHDSNRKATRRPFRDDIDTCLEYIGFLQNELDRLRKKIQDPRGTITKLESDVESSEFDLMAKRFLFEFQVEFLDLRHSNSSGSEAALSPSSFYDIVPMKLGQQRMGRYMHFIGAMLETSISFITLTYEMGDRRKLFMFGSIT